MHDMGHEDKEDDNNNNNNDDDDYKANCRVCKKRITRLQSVD